MDIIYHLVNGILQIYLLCFFFETFSEKKTFKGKYIYIFSITTIFILSLLFLDVGLIKFLILILVSFLISILYELKWHTKIFLTAIIVTLSSLSETAVALFSSYILNKEIAVLKTGIYLFAGMMVSKLIIFAIIAIIKFGKHSLPKFKISMLWSYIGFMLITSIMIIFVILDYMYYIMDNPSKKVIAISVIITLILTNIALFYIIDKICDYFIVKQNLLIANTLVENQKLTYKELYDNQVQIRKIKHDLKNTMIGILHELDNDNISNAKEHIKTSCELLESQNSFICGYSIIDTILSIKNERAISLGIKLDVEIELQQRIGIDTIDLSVIMGNAIDNAIEATEKLSSNHKAVDISIISKNYSLIIIIKNPVPHKIDISNLISTKADSESHGYGILQMRSLAKKYNGDIFFDCNDEQFKTTIILNYNE